MASEIQTPNRVADAAELLHQFIVGEDPIVASEPRTPAAIMNDDRAAVIGVQLLAIASQAERIADALDALVGFAAILAYPGRLPASRFARHHAGTIKDHTFTLDDASEYGGEEVES